MNEAIRSTAKQKHVRLWEVAEALGITDGNFSRKLRRELPNDEQTRIINIINDISEREGR